MATDLAHLPLAIVAHVQPLTRQAISQALEGLMVVWDAPSLQHAVGLARQVPPDYLFVGEVLPDGTPTELIYQLRQAQDHLVVIQLTQGSVDLYLPEPVAEGQVREVVTALPRLRRVA
ncbi:MAG: hypothetical protein KKB13_10455 [Chloroflexi bacterium]|nr:hypothetical protein [Chloroflexota bacterium]